MAKHVTKIVLDLAAKLHEPKFRRKFFEGLAQQEIAMQIRELREIRKMRQTDLAKATGMLQSAVARLEKAEYARWSYRTLSRLASALDARVKVVLQPSEDAIIELSSLEAESAVNRAVVGSRATQTARARIQADKSFAPSEATNASSGTHISARLQ